MGVWFLKKRNSMLYSAVILTGATLLLRLAAMGFQVCLSGRIGAEGIGLVQIIFSVEELAFTVGAAGIRSCATYLSAEELGRRRPQGIHSVLSGCFQYSLICSVPTALALWQLSPRLAQSWIGNTAVISALRLYAVFLPVRCLYGVMTGYFTSAGRLKDFVTVEFLEQICSMAVTLLLLLHWAGADAGRACLSVTAGNCAASVLAFGALLFLYHGSLPPRTPNQPTPYRRILRMAVPLGIANTLRSGLNTIEDLVVPRRLTLFAGTVNAMADFGTVRGMVFPVLMFPAAILFSLAELLVPELSRCSAGQRQPRVRYLVRRGLRVSLLFGLCTGGLLFSVGRSLGALLYQNPVAGAYLRLYAPLVPVLYMDAIVDALCKGLGQQSANARYNVLTSFLDVLFLWLLLPRFGLFGYYFSFALTHLVNFCLSLRRLMLASGVRLTPGLPLRALLGVSAAAWLTSLLPSWGGYWGAVLPGAYYLLMVSLFWSLLRVVNRADALWLQSLPGRRRRHTDGGCAS